MNLRKVTAASAVALTLALTATACGGDSDSGSGGGGGKITIGIKVDQPGLGQETPDGYKGFDIDVAKYVAKQLGYDESDITWKEAPSKERENLLRRGDVDFIVATYSITDQRKEKVSFAGPYFLAHQDLLIRTKDNVKSGDDLNKKKLCSVTGSTSAQNVKKKFAPDSQLQEYGGYSECLSGLESGAVDALTTDDSILAGYAAQQQYQGKFKLAGLNLSDEYYGIGIKKGDTELQGKINDALKKMEDDGSWEKAVKANFGPANYDFEPAPQITEQG
ncbi:MULTISPECIES: glutamate ABC transporter substrate-binding protein [unclassified Streptomyces]|uniref:glutamate ABC transporter substrate-binding protein n=1 Tax=unclassified Streptomyces TaxID=2593676 RepID=UPI001F0460C0|nr:MULTISPECIES: glutamate ABC transporter substrate-binding protein [unclassified Streptomyces]MCH0561922.1 glutamate ABC transporter substrate-binding protein [Streptomyces sp. MUM 2J]MCH0568765.1 glutamate ABC transporter substrate-binding protein [Streptomyces sp. MUM 136J]